MAFSASQAGAIRVIRPSGPVQLDRRGPRPIRRASRTAMRPVYRDVQLTFEKIGDTLFAVADSIFASPYFIWYRDGSYIRTTRENFCSFTEDPGGQSYIECIDTTDPNFDVIANGPDNYAAAITLYFIRSFSTDTEYYLVQQKKEGGSWVTITKQPHDESIWEYKVESLRLDDRSDYEFQVIPYDIHGNPGTAIQVDAITVVRYPDATNFDGEYSDITNKITWSIA